MNTRRERKRPGGGFQQLLMIAAACIVFLLLYAQQTAVSTLYQPPPSSYQKDDSIIMIPTVEGQEVAAYVGIKTPNAYTVFYFHGNATDLGQDMPLLRNYQLKGFNVICFDYRGYGLTPGSPSETAIYEDADAVYQYILDELKIPESKIVLHGYSLGSGPAMEMAVRRKPAGLILESGFRTAFKVVFPLKWIPGDRFKNEGKAKNVSCPVLIIHGQVDELIDVSHGQAMEKAFKPDQANLLIVPNAGHNNLRQVAGEAYFRSIQTFVSKLEK